MYGWRTFDGAVTNATEPALASTPTRSWTPRESLSLMRNATQGYR